MKEKKKGFFTDKTVSSSEKSWFPQWHMLVVSKEDTRDRLPTPLHPPRKKDENADGRLWDSAPPGREKPGRRNGPLTSQHLRPGALAFSPERGKNPEACLKLRLL